MTTKEDTPEVGSIRRELGEVVGTLKMTVVAVDQLRDAVNRIIERAAFKGDIETLRADLVKLITEHHLEAVKEVDSLKAKVNLQQKMFWMIAGGALVTGVLIKFIHIPSSFVAGN